METPTTTPQGEGPNVAAVTTEATVPSGNTSAPGTPPQDSNRNRTNDIITWVIVGALFVFVGLRWPNLAYSIVAFVVTLSVLVFVHEWGHYQFARWAGMKVNRFAIGFPPWIYTRRHKEIDYSIGALPIGGMVDIAGLGSEEEMVATAQGAGVTTRGRRSDVPFGQRQFQDARLGWRFWTLFAGPLMNFLFAILIFVVAFSIAGVPTDAGKATQKIDSIKAGSPAEQAGLKSGDVVVSVDSKKANDAKHIKAMIKSGSAAEIQIGIRRDGQEMVLPVRPKIDEIPTDDGKGKTKQRIIGVIFEPVFTTERVSLPVAVAKGVTSSLNISVNILDMLRRLITGKLTSEERSGIKGPIGIAEQAGESAKRGWQHSALFAGMLSVNLALLNLLPFPALDGGRILFLGYEMIARRPFDPRKETIVHMVGMVMLLALILFISVRDLMPYITTGLNKMMSG